MLVSSYQMPFIGQSLLIQTPKKTGTYGGMTHFFVNSATIIAPTLTGILVTSYGYSSMFISAVIAAVIGIIAMCFVKPGIKKISINN